MVELVISGGQTGADIAGWHAAKACGIQTGGWMPKGFLTEDGKHPEFAAMYGAKEHPSRHYRDRTISNIGLADMTLLFGDESSPGSQLVITQAAIIDHPVVKISFIKQGPGPSYVEQIIRRRGDVKSLNIAGNRESSSALGFSRWVEQYLVVLFGFLKEGS